MGDEKVSGDSVTISKNTLYLLVIGLLFVILGASIFTGGFGFVKTTGTSSTTTTTTTTGTGTTPIVTETPIARAGFASYIGSNPSKGAETAKIVVAEFSNYECPFCWRHTQTTLPQLMRNYVDTGKVKYYFLDYPVTHGEWGDEASKASKCAGESGKFWEMHDKIYEQRNAWADKPESPITLFTQMAKELGIDDTAFQKCVNSDKYDAAIQSDISMGGKLRVGTPAFLVTVAKSDVDAVKMRTQINAIRNNGYSQYITDVLETEDGKYLVIVQGALPYETFRDLFAAMGA